MQTEHRRGVRGEPCVRGTGVHTNYSTGSGSWVLKARVYVGIDRSVYVLLVDLNR